MPGTFGGVVHLGVVVCLAVLTARQRLLRDGVIVAGATRTGDRLLVHIIQEHFVVVAVGGVVTSPVATPVVRFLLRVVLGADALSEVVVVVGLALGVLIGLVTVEVIILGVIVPVPVILTGCCCDSWRSFRRVGLSFITPGIGKEKSLSV